MNAENKKRFANAIHRSLEDLARDAKCFGYQHDPDYNQVVDQLKTKERQLRDDISQWEV